MKIAFCMERLYLETGGGGRIQILKTKEYLEKLYSDIQIYIVHNVNDIEEGTDILHLFNILDVDFIKSCILYAKENSIKTCLSTIYWDFSYTVLSSFLAKIFGYNYTYRKYSIEKIIAKITGLLINKPIYYSKKNINDYRYIVENVDILLPNSREEGTKLLEYVGLNCEDKIFPIVNAVDFKDNNVSPSVELPQNYILEVGRIEPIKNQYMLVKAMMDVPEFSIVFLGKDRNPNSKYSKQLHKMARKRGNVFFYDEIPYEQVGHFYKNALVHILPSLRESPGLVSLEALFNGCKAVVACDDFTPGTSYFGSFVTRVDPLSCKSIKDGRFRFNEKIT